MNADAHHADYTELSESFRTTAFVDILGWGSLTAGVDSLTLRRIARNEPLTSNDRAAAARLTHDIGIAKRIDTDVREILTELEGLATPATVGGLPYARHHWQNMHVTFVRASDNIFLHGTSFRTVAIFVAELMKRGLDRGILFRTGLSCGFVRHLDPPGPPGLDARSRSISIFGDGITTAVAAEKAGGGLGVRAIAHPQLVKLLTGDDLGLIGNVELPNKGNPIEGKEFRWWSDLAGTFPNNAGIEACSPITDVWLRETADHLARAPEFDWNRRSRDGLRPVKDTQALLERALRELAEKR